MATSAKKSFTTRTDATRDDWQTPKHIVDALGTFDLDPCADKSDPNRLAPVGYTKDGLALPWHGRVWLNPPYGSAAQVWVGKLAQHGDGIALIPPRMGSRWFQAFLKNADALLFLRGRISFINPATGRPVGGNNADSVLVAFGANNVRALQASGLSGIFIDCSTGMTIR